MKEKKKEQRFRTLFGTTKHQRRGRKQEGEEIRKKGSLRFK